MASNGGATTTVHSTNTTFVQVDPSTFRAVVQKLTGAPPANSTVSSQTQKLPLMSFPTRSGFLLHERRQRQRQRPTSNKLELELNSNSTVFSWPPARGIIGTESTAYMVSPVSTLDFLGRGSPREEGVEEEEEKAAIAERGFYLHPSPMNTPRGSEPPELLPLFPVHSLRDHNDSSSSC